MERRAVYCLTGALAALSLVALPAIAQNDTKSTVTTFTTVRTDMMVPVTPDEDRIATLRMMSDMGFTKGDYAKLLPLLEDLQMAEQNYYAAAGGAVFNLAFAQPDSGRDMRALDDVNTARTIFREKQTSVWNTISQHIGNDKAMSLRRMVEPMSEDVSRTTYRSMRIERIDSLLRDLDRFANSRASVDESGQPGASTVAVTTTTTTVAEPIYITTIPPLSVGELADLVELRLAAMEASPEDLIFWEQHRDLTSPDVRFLREKHLKMWD
jgi:hypothetical protein